MLKDNISNMSLNTGLTPIRIRGKKRATPIARGEKGRNITTKGVGIDKEAKRNGRMRKSSLAPIELLPTEILDLIFSYTVNPNLLRASFTIARKLSGPNVIVRHCRRIFRAFSYSFESDELETKAVYYAIDEDRTVEYPHENARAQRDTFLIPGLTGEYVFRLCKFLVNEEKQRIQRLFNRLGEVFPLNKKGLPSSVLINDFHGPPFLLRSEQDLGQFQRSLQISFNFESIIPSKLLRYPLTPDSQKLLQFLVLHNARIAHDNLDGETALESWNQAVRAKEYRLVWLLLSPGIGVRPSPNELEVALEIIDWDAAMFRLIALCCDGPTDIIVPLVTHFELEDYMNLNNQAVQRFLSLPLSAESLCPSSETYPRAWIKARAKNPDGSRGREILDDTSNRALYDILEQSS